MSSSLGSFDPIGKDVLTLILLHLEDYEVVFVTRMLSKAFQLHFSKMHWHSIYNKFREFCDGIVITTKYPLYQATDNCWMVGFLRLTRMRLHRYVSYGTKKHLNYITDLPDTLHWISPADQRFTLPPANLTESIYDFRGVPPTKDRHTWMVYVSTKIYTGTWSRKSIKKGTHFYQDPALIADLIVEMAHAEYLDDFRDDELAVIYDHSTDLEVLKMFEGAAFCSHPYELTDPFEYGVFELTANSTDVIAASRRLPVPFTVEALQLKLTRDFTTGDVTQMKIHNIQYSDPERSYVLIKRVMMTDFTRPLPEAVLQDMQNAKNQLSDPNKTPSDGMVQLP
jgi:hypothetical protein